MWKKGDQYCLASMDHGKARDIRCFSTLAEAVAEHVLVVTGCTNAGNEKRIVSGKWLHVENRGSLGLHSIDRQWEKVETRREAHMKTQLSKPPRHKARYTEE